MLCRCTADAIRTVVDQSGLTIAFGYQSITRNTSAYDVIDCGLCTALRQSLVVLMRSAAICMARQLDTQARVVPHGGHELIQDQCSIRPDIVLIKVVVNIFQHKLVTHLKYRLQVEGNPYGSILTCID